MDKVVKQEFGIDRTARSLGVELYGEKRLRPVPDAFARPVVEVHEVRLPALVERRRIDGEAVVLGRDDGPVRAHHQRRLVVAPMTVLELEGRRSGRDRQQLVAQTDAEDRLAQRDRLADVGDRRPALLRVAGAVRQHHPVVFE